MQIAEVKYLIPSGNDWIKVPGVLEFDAGRIIFADSPFSLKDDIKAMKGSKWHGFLEENPRKVWSVDDCFRNRIQLDYLLGGNPFAWFDQPLKTFEYDRPLREHQKDMSNNGLTYHYQIWAAEMRTGKGGLPTTKIATPTGWTTFGDVKVGDEVINPEGGSTRVKGVYHRGQMEMFRVTFSDGSSTVCSGDHLWNVRTAVRKNRGMPYETLELRKILARGLHRTNGNAKHYIPMVAPVQYSGTPLPLDPYLVGYILGNGGLSGYANVISIPDEDTVNRLDSCMEVPLRPKNGSDYDYHVADTSVNQFIDDAGLNGCRSHEKVVPDNYLFSTVESRVALLQGLCDSDGHACHTGGVEYSTTSPNLRDAFVFLVQSLGGTCAVSENFPTYTYKGERRTGRLAYRIYASFPSNISPFCLKRKADAYVVPTKFEPTRAMASVESIGDEECICIAVESENQLYVTDDFIVTHNTLSAIEVMEKSEVKTWWWVGPKPTLPAIQLEFKKWGLSPDVNVEMFTFDAVKKALNEVDSGAREVPQGLIVDESSKASNETAQRTVSLQRVADRIRAKYGHDGYIILMSGTPAPKSPIKWWSQAEIVYPGFLREGSAKALEQRLGFFEKKEFDSGIVNDRFSWRDDEKKCNICGKYEDDEAHQDWAGGHQWVPSVNEVAFLHERLKGLVVIKFKKDCLDLPDMIFEEVVCKPSPSVLRVAKSIMESSPNVMTAMTLVRELSDGFQYRDVPDGTKPCGHCSSTGKVEEWFDTDGDSYEAIDMLRPEVVSQLEKRTVDCPVCGGDGEVPKMARTVREIPCPKEPALIEMLNRCEDVGRILVFAGFTGSVDKCVGICLKQGWNVVRCDGRGYQLLRPQSDGTVIRENKVPVLEFWADMSNERVAFVAHPESGGMGLTLTQAPMVVFWSNGFKPEYRIQAMARIHGDGMCLNRGATVVDLIHLPTDRRVLEIVNENRRIELMTLGEVMEGIDWGLDETSNQEEAS